MCKATIDLISPHGGPVTLEVCAEDKPQAIIGTLERAEKVGLRIPKGEKPPEVKGL